MRRIDGEQRCLALALVGAELLPLEGNEPQVLPAHHQVAPAPSPGSARPRDRLPHEWSRHTSALLPKDVCPNVRARKLVPGERKFTADKQSVKISSAFVSIWTRACQTIFAP